MKNIATPFFSVVIPVYKTALQSLVCCLNQVLNSTYENFEIIVVMDGVESDFKAEMKKRYNDRRVNILEQEHKGLGVARNFGMSFAKGEYMLFLDADDILLPEALMKLREKIQNDRNLDVILFPWQNYIDVPIGPTYQNTNQSSVNVAVWNKCYRVEYLSNIKFATGVLYEDILFTFQTVFKTNNIGRVLGEPLYLYRVNKESSITASMENQKHALLLIKEVIDHRHDVSETFSEFDVLIYIYFCWKFHLDAALMKNDTDLLNGLVSLGKLIPGFPCNAVPKKSFFHRIKLKALGVELERGNYESAYTLNSSHGIYGGMLAVWSLINTGMLFQNCERIFLKY